MARIHTGSHSQSARPTSIPFDQDNFAFEAFISYCRKPTDTYYAKWIQRCIEHFKIPAEYRTNQQRRFRRVFRDEDELAAGPDLPAAIDHALGSSRYLVVVCTKSTPKSTWVEREVQRFQDLGRADSVLLLLVDGGPDESFPLNLKKVPAAADIRPGPTNTRRAARRKARLQILAPLVGCSFEDLRRRNREIRFRQGLAAFASIALVSLAVAVWSWSSLQQERIRLRASHLLAEVSLTETLSDAEVHALGELHESNPSIRESFVEQMLESPGTARRFLGRTDVIMRSLVGASTKRRTEIANVLSASLHNDPKSPSFAIATARLRMASWLELSQGTKEQWNRTFDELLDFYRTNIDEPIESMLPLFRAAAQRSSLDFVRRRGEDLLSEILEADEGAWPASFKLSKIAATLTAQAPDRDILSALDKTAGWLPGHQEPSYQHLIVVSDLAQEISLKDDYTDIEKLTWQRTYEALNIRTLTLFGHFLSELLGDKLDGAPQRLKLVARLERMIVSTESWEEVRLITGLIEYFYIHQTDHPIIASAESIEHILAFSTETDTETLQQSVIALYGAMKHEVQEEVATILIGEIEASNDPERHSIIAKIVSHFDSLGAPIALPWSSVAMKRARQLWAASEDLYGATNAGSLVNAISERVPPDLALPQLLTLLKAADQQQILFTESITQACMTLAGQITESQKPDASREILMISRKTELADALILSTTAYIAVTQDSDSPPDIDFLVRRLWRAAAQGTPNAWSTLMLLAPSIEGQSAWDLFNDSLTLAEAEESPEENLPTILAAQLDRSHHQAAVELIIHSLEKESSGLIAANLARTLRSISKRPVEIADAEMLTERLLNTVSQQQEVNLEALTSAVLSLQEIAPHDFLKSATLTEITRPTLLPTSLTILCQATALNDSVSLEHFDSLADRLKSASSLEEFIETTHCYRVLREAKSEVGREFQDSDLAQQLIILLQGTRNTALLERGALELSIILRWIPDEKRPWHPDILEKLANNLRTITEFPVKFEHNFRFLVHVYSEIAKTAPEGAELFPGRADLSLVRMNRDSLFLPDFALIQFLQVYQWYDTNEVSDAYLLLLALEPCLEKRVQLISEALPDIILAPQVEMIVRAIDELDPVNLRDVHALTQLLMCPAVGLHREIEKAILDRAGRAVPLRSDQRHSAQIWQLVQALEEDPELLNHDFRLCWGTVPQEESGRR